MIPYSIPWLVPVQVGLKLAQGHVSKSSICQTSACTKLGIYGMFEKQPQSKCAQPQPIPFSSPDPVRHNLQLAQAYYLAYHLAVGSRRIGGLEGMLEYLAVQDSSGAWAPPQVPVWRFSPSPVR